MAKIKNVSGDDLTLPWLGDRLVLAGQVVEVPDADVYAYTQQALWNPTDEAAKAAHDAAADEVPADPDAIVEPAGNASREDWVAFVVAAGRATEADLTDLSRDEIRDTYKTEEV